MRLNVLLHVLADKLKRNISCAKYRRHFIKIISGIHAGIRSECPPIFLEFVFQFLRNKKKLSSSTASKISDSLHLLGYLVENDGSLLDTNY